MPELTARPTLDTTLAHQTLTALREPHTHGHRCDDGQWYNRTAGTRTACRTFTRLETLATLIDRMAQAPHAAAHHDPIVTAVAEGMTGLVLADLGEEEREGWMQTARYAIEALAALLDPDAHPASPEANLTDWDPGETGGRHRAEDSDPADYGYADLPRVNGIAVIPPTPPELTICRACQHPAIEHTQGRFSIYGVCPVT